MSRTTWVEGSHRYDALKPVPVINRIAATKVYHQFHMSISNIPWSYRILFFDMSRLQYIMRLCFAASS